MAFPLLLLFLVYVNLSAYCTAQILLAPPAKLVQKPLQVAIPPMRTASTTTLHTIVTSYISTTTVTATRTRHSTFDGDNMINSVARIETQRAARY